MKQNNPPHPGKLVADNIAALNLTLQYVAMALDISPHTLKLITMQQIAISPEMALRLSHVFGSSPEWWLRMQNVYSLFYAEQEIDLSRLKILHSSSGNII